MSFVVQQPKVGLGCLIIKISNPLGLLTATDQFITQHKTNIRDDHPCTQQDSNPRY
jgi:hypothetical protein